MAKDKDETSNEAEETKDSSSNEESTANATEASSPSEGEVGFVPQIRMVDSAVGVVEHAFLGVCLFGLIFLGAYHFTFSTFAGMNDTWPFEILRYLVFFIALSGACLAAQRGNMISMDFVARMLSPKKRTILRIFTSVFVIFVCYLFYKGGMVARDAAQGEHYEIISPKLALLALPVSAILIAFHYFLHILIDISYLKEGLTPPEAEGPQAH